MDTRGVKEFCYYGYVVKWYSFKQLRKISGMVIQVIAKLGRGFRGLNVAIRFAEIGQLGRGG